jgi:indole-3-acetate monooxygenase
LRSIGVFRIFVPQSHGGLELTLPEGLEIIRALARIDASIGWISMIGSGGALVASLFSKENYEEFYKNGPDVIIAGSNLPVGTAEQIDGGWLVNGRWPFASGCRHADWIIGLCVMTSGGKPLPGSGGKAGPLIRAFILPASRWQIEDTWHVIGLKGTGSHHIALKDTIVPDSHFFDIVGGKPCLPGPLYQDVVSSFSILHGAIAVGIAEAALDDVLQLANANWKQLRGTVAIRDSESVQGELGRISANVRAAQAFFEGQATSLWQHVIAGTTRNSGVSAQVTQTLVWLANTSLQATDACFALAGSIALYENFPLQRRLRDIRTAAQHGVVQQRNYVAVGKSILDSYAVAHNG